MRSFRTLAFAIAAMGCGSPPSLSPHPSGYAGRMEAADAHSARAAQHRLAARAPDSARVENYQCGDQNDMSDQLTSGGQRIMPMVPCWDPVEEHAQRERAAARREDYIARKERRSAVALAETKLDACRGISEGELGHSPFAHRRAIAAVIPHQVGGVVRGVRIVFKPVAGLTRSWLEQSIACHRAEFERLGEPATYLSDDPTLVRGAVATVASHRGHLEVLVETRDDVAASVALARARDLIGTRTAGR